MDSTKNLTTFAAAYAELMQPAASLAARFQSKAVARATEAEFSVSDLGIIQKAFLSSAIARAHRPDPMFAFQADILTNVNRM